MTQREILFQGRDDLLVNGLRLTVVADETSPCTTNILGAKGAGECGSTGAPPAVVGAVCDALKDFGVVHLDMPISGEDVWRAMNGGR